MNDKTLGTRPMSAEAAQWLVRGLEAIRLRCEHPESYARDWHKVIFNIAGQALAAAREADDRVDRLSLMGKAERDLRALAAEAALKLGGPVRIAKTEMRDDSRLVITWERE